MFKRLLGSQETGHRKRSRSRWPRVEWMEPRTLLTAVSWTGTAGDNNWDTPGNWSTDSVPGAGDDVTIAIAANVVHSNNVTDSINSLTSSEPLTISGGTLSIAAASTLSTTTISGGTLSIAATSTITNTLSITGGTLTGAGNVTVSGLVTLQTGTLSGSSALNANGGMLIDPINDSTETFAIDGRVVNNALGQTATWSGTDNAILVSDGSVFNNLGTFLAEATGFYNDTGTGAASEFVDQGSFTQSGVGNRAEFQVLFNVPGGSVDVQNGGTLELENGGTSTGGAFTLVGDLLISNNPYTFDPTTTISGAGGIQFNGFTGPQLLPGNYSYTGSTALSGANLQIDGSIASSAVNLEGTLSGTGTAGSIGGNEGGEISPGDGGATGILNVQNDVDLSDGDFTFTVLLNGPNAGTGYSQLNVGGSINLGGTELDASLGNGFTPTPGEQFTIIKSNAPVVSTFDDLPQGASVPIGNSTFTISYVGGTGDDVVLTAAAAAAPTVTSLNPVFGPDAGGTPVTIFGTGFTGATVVDFGTNAGTDLFVVNDTTITVDSPAGTGVVDVTVTTPAGTSSGSDTTLFVYALTVTGISPTTGPTTGGTPVTITGTSFLFATAVDFGTNAATDFVVVNDTTITVDSPAGTGVVDVTVTSPAGTTPATPADEFTYTAVAAPTVTGISPASGPTIGGTPVTITGTRFTGATTVDFGTTAATDLVVVNDTTITADSPAGSGIANVTVTTPGGTSTATSADQFTYVVTPPPTVVSLLRFGFHAQPTSLVLTFSSPLDATRAEDAHNFRIVTLGGKGKNGNLVGHVTRVNAAVYDSSTLTVTLFTAQRLDIHNLYQLTVNGTTPSGLTGATGVPLAGQGGVSGTNYVKVISGKLLAGPAPSTLNAARRPNAAPGRVIKGPSAAAFDHLLASGKWTARLNSARIHGGHHHRRG